MKESENRKSLVLETEKKNLDSEMEKKEEESPNCETESKKKKVKTKEEKIVEAKNDTRAFLVKTAYGMEMLVGAFLIIAIIITCFSMLGSLRILALSPDGLDGFLSFLEHLFTVVIGIEFLKMLCHYNMDSVIEVLLFALARQMIINHGTALDQLLTVLSISILFFIRKYLFVKGLDVDDPGVLPSRQLDAEEGEESK